MEEEQPQDTLTMSVSRPSFSVEEQQSGAFAPAADAALVTLGRMVIGSSVNRTKGAITGNIYSRRNISVAGKIHINDFRVYASFDNSSREDYIDCLTRLGSTTSAKDLTTHLKNEEQCIDGTCDWFIGLDQYQSWHSENDCPLLLFLGNAGMGKTMMCHFLIEKLSDVDNRQDRRKTVAYFFCDYHPQRSTATAVLAGLLVQLLQKRGDKFKNVRDDYLQYRESLTHDFDNLWAIFYKFLKSLDGDVYLIIDGMDKCDEPSRQELFALLSTSLKIRTTGLTIKILLTSRPESDFPTIPKCRILKVEQRNVSEHLKMSVSKFIQVRVKTLPVSSEVKRKIHQEISRKAGETYLWASFVLQDLEKAHTDEEVDIKFKNLPQDLHEVYDKMLRDIDPAEAEEAAFVLRMAALARRPLIPRELGLLYVLRPERKNPHRLQSLKQVKPYRDLHTACRSLVNVDSSGAVSFVHQSVKEHLLDGQLSTNYRSSSSFICSIFPGLAKSRVYMFFASSIGKALGVLGLMRGISRYYVAPDETHLLLLKICWTCFGTEEFQHGNKIIQRKEDDELSPNPDLQEVLESRPELSYMVEEWQNHALAAGPALSTCHAWLSDNLDKLPNLRDLWLHHVVLAGDVNTARLLLDNHADVKTRWGDYGSILHGPSSTGNEKMVKLLIDHGADIDAKGRLFDNALEAASSNGHAKIVQLLLEHEATVNSQDGNSCSALQIAAANNYTEVVRTLLRYGANVNSCGGRYARPLQGAARAGHVEVVQLLLNSGADVNAQGQGHTYALQAASCVGDLETVKLLVKHGAEINATGGTHGSALDAAIDRNNDGVKKWLTECGAVSSSRMDDDGNQLYLAALMGEVEEVEALLEYYNVNVQGGKHGSPLHAAAYNGHENVVQLLINNRANVNAEGGKYGSPLQAAASGGHENIVQQLIDRGANVDAQGGSHGNALHAAAALGRVETMRVLLNHGVSANIYGEEYGTALHAAIRGNSCNKTEASRLLLENGALANVHSGFFGTPLLLAACKGKIDIAELLVDYGANVNAKCGYCGFPLQMAALFGKKEMVKWLLDSGALINAEGGCLGFALQAAAGAGENGVVQLLLDNGALINAEGGQYGFALQAAAKEGKKDTVELLLKCGANINANGGEFGSALQAAAYQGDKEIVEYLLDSGADIDAKGGKYGFALQAAAYEGAKEIVKLLLDRRANVNSEGGEYGSALQAAAYKGEREIVELLLDRGALINAEGGPYGTALEAARCGDHENVVQLLLHWRGARLNRKGSWAIHRVGSWGTQVGKVSVDGRAADPTSPTFPSSGTLTSLAAMLASFWGPLNGFSL